MLLLKRGGEVLYNGPLGYESQSMIRYFEATPGVPRIAETANPATWMLEISTISAEQKLGVDLAALYQKSSLARCATFGHIDEVPCTPIILAIGISYFYKSSVCA